MMKSQLPIETIDLDKYQHRLQTAELIVADLIAPKVMQLDNGNIIKLFRRKRWFSTAMFAPYAVRFTNNAIQLKTLGIPTVTPVGLQYCPAAKTHIVEYQPLPGQLLRQALQANHSLFEATAKFIAKLHQNGVYFRSLHFENIVLTDDGSLGLIDVADMKIYNSPLSSSLRKRNFQHFMRYPQDAQLIHSFGEDNFQKLYIKYAY